MAEHNIKFSDYDYGQPEGEKNGLHIRNKAGDNRVTLLGVAFLVVPLIIGAIFAIPGVQEFRESRENVAEIAFGDDFFKNDDGEISCGGRDIRLAALHEAKDLTDASALEVTILVQNRSKGTVARASNAVTLDGVDLTATTLDHGISSSDFVRSNANSRPAVCAYQIKIVR